MKSNGSAAALMPYTSTEKTCFYAKVLKKHFSVAADVIADILQKIPC